eukprot:2340017-Prymnesium_polylepis.1
MSGAELATSNFRRKHPPKVFKHYQDSGVPSSPEMDDYHSPTQPAKYINLRIKPMLVFFEQRIPQYTRHNNLLKSSTLADYDGSLRPSLRAK